MHLDRRAFLAGGVTLVAMPAPLPAAAAPRTRRFRVLRDGDEVGTQSLTVTEAAGEIIARTEIDIRVRVLGLTAYRYALEVEERWRGGRLIALNGTCDDDGTAEFVRAKARGDRLLVEGSGHRGEIDGMAAPTSYWSPEFPRRGLWISTQSGAPLKVSCRPAGAGEVPTASGRLLADRWQVSGDLELELFYAGGEWAGTAFEAGGAPGMVAATALGPALPRLA